MFNRKKHRRVQYVTCPYCGANPVIVDGMTRKCETVMHYECPHHHLLTGDTPYPARALELWLLAVGKVLKCDDMIRNYLENNKGGTHGGNEPS